MTRYTPSTFCFRNATDALPVLLDYMLINGSEVGSRQGERTFEILTPQIMLTHPWEREILTPLRKASLPAQIAETMWVLAGRGDIEWLSHYLSRAGEFSDDGKYWRGAYGPRIRDWRSMGINGPQHTDQLRHVVELLKHDRGTRRAVINIYDPAVDTQDGKDIPCNNWLSFISRNGYLHLNVAIRSNDVIWGWSGINQFEWSVLQEIVAKMTGNMIGNLTFNVTSFHLYEKHWEKARNIVKESRGMVPSALSSPGFSLKSVKERPDWHTTDSDIDLLNELISEWFRAEEKIRNGEYYDVSEFPEPMFRSWLYVLEWYWSQDDSVLGLHLANTRLRAAAFQSPKRKVEKPTTRDQDKPLAYQAEFIDFVSKLHEEKGAVYGDSWKKRGESFSIIPNILRKSDRLGVAGGGDTAADTVIDLLVYLAKYRLWLSYEQMAPTYDGKLYLPVDFNENVEVRLLLSRVSRIATAATQRADLPKQIEALESLCEVLASSVAEGVSPIQKAGVVNEALPLAFSAAKRLWAEEQGHIAADADTSDGIEVGKMAPVRDITEKARARQDRDVESVKQAAQRLDSNHAERNAQRRWNGYEEI